MLSFRCKNGIVLVWILSKFFSVIWVISITWSINLIIKTLFIYHVKSLKCIKYIDPSNRTWYRPLSHSWFRHSAVNISCGGLNISNPRAMTVYSTVYTLLKMDLYFSCRQLLTILQFCRKRNRGRFSMQWNSENFFAYL